jgi:ribosome recycling factor
MFAELKADLENKMEKVISVLNKDLAGIRTGRVSSNFLNTVVVEVYGDRMPISQLATVTVQDGNLLVVQVWDRSVVKNIEKAINLAGLGVSASSEGQTIKVPIPPLSEERRKELVKLSIKAGEQSKVAIRNIRRHGMDFIKTMDTISKDDIHRGNEEVQKMTDQYIVKVDSLLQVKEKDIMHV